MKYVLSFLCIFLVLQDSKSRFLKPNLYFPELKYVDESINPCDDFYKFSCGNFEKFNPRPENEKLWDNFKILQAKMNNFAIDILNSSIRSYDPSAVKKAKDMYHACINPDISAEQSIKPLKDAFDKLGGWPLVSDIPKSRRIFSWDFLANVVSEFGLPIFFSWTIMPYLDSTKNMITLLKDPLQLPANAITSIEDFETEIPIDFKASSDKPYYIQYLINVSKKFVRPDHLPIYEEKIEKGIEEVFEILQFINLLKDKELESEEFGEIDNLKDLQEWTDVFQKDFVKKIDWVSFFSKAFSKSDVKITAESKINVSFQYIVKTILTLVENTDDETLLNFIFTRLATFTAQDANLEMWDLFNDLYTKLKYSVYTREEYCMRKVTSYPEIGLSLAVAHEYQNYYFDLRKISQPEKMIENILKSFFELLDEKDWIDSEAKTWIQNKTENMVRLVAFPDYVYDKTKLDEYYSNLDICIHDHFGNSQRIRAFNFVKNIENLDKPRRRDIWSQSPLIVNAFYNAANNRLIYPVGIMNEPFFTGFSKLVDYSRIGALIGHEITHGFDTKGRLYDGNGNYVSNVWNANVTAAFKEKSDCFIKQYNDYYIEKINSTVKGALTNPENIADNGGIREAFRAFQKLDISEYKTEKYSPEQLFFISYATMWCKIDTIESLTLMQKDTHAPNRFRVIGTLSNMKEFADVFECPLGSKMNPENKCVLW